jgi:peptidoglycan hydrolase CwlO-like protein
MKLERTYMPKYSTEILTAAIEGFEAQKRRINTQIAELRQMLDGNRTELATMPELPKRRRKMSAAARKHIAEAQQKRWAEAKKPSKPTEVPKTKRRLSAAGRRRIIEATKRRWALSRAAA